MEDNQFVLSCPACYSPDHVAYRLRLHFAGMKILDIGPIYGEAVRHCEACGLKFAATSGVELRALEPTTPRNEAIAKYAGVTIGKAAKPLESYWPMDILYV